MSRRLAEGLVFAAMILFGFGGGRMVWGGADDDGAAAGFAFDGHRAADHPRPEFHDAQAHAFGLGSFFQRKAGAVVADAEINPARISLEVDGNFPGLAMLDRVGNRLLRKPEKMRGHGVI